VVTLLRGAARLVHPEKHGLDPTEGMASAEAAAATTLETIEKQRTRTRAVQTVLIGVTARKKSPIDAIADSQEDSQPRGAGGLKRAILESEGTRSN
jgi:hypothetical protein